MPAVEAAAADATARLGLFPDPDKGQCRFLVTAGPTCEDIDAVRFLGNRSTGRTGLALAAAARDAGHQVLLVLGPTLLEPPAGVEVVEVRCAREMLAATKAAFDWCDVLIMSAAVADYRPADYFDGKIHKTADELHIRLVRNPDILAELAETRTDQVLIGFSLDTRIDTEEAETKRRAKGMDLIVANTEHAFGGVSTDAVILEKNHPTVTAGPNKEKLARHLVERAEAMIEEVRSRRTASQRFTNRRHVLPDTGDDVDDA
jgi:phosphopantothenoylcysteine decarboxylase/phosphopantothenate--cysteine ligase